MTGTSPGAAPTEPATTLPKRYDPRQVEPRLYEHWERSGYFRPEQNPDGKPFVITIPPPNVTGELHLGHALTYTIEDVLGRYKRMRGYSTLILPGSDHASIAVHAKIEAMLAGEGIRRRFDIGRERFLERAWEWKEKYAAAIEKQFRALGESYDWSRSRFTMDPPYHRAVMAMFVRLYDEGFIYRGSRVINWCPGCKTGISDIEVRQEERDDKLYFVRLPFADGSGELVVATVRPETMFGDVAVAVHPDDKRYADAVGKTVSHPLTGLEIPVIADAFVDPEFGTGAVKITPAHDYEDFEVGERHELPMPVVITTDAAMAEHVPAPYGGMPVEEARAAAVDQLDREGFLVRVDPHRHSVPLCDRCGSVIEPLLSEQWFMRMNELAEPAIEAVKSGQVTFVPDRWAKVYLDWMENIRPWNISRQLWWGHRIPIYHCGNGHVMASVDPPDACKECSSTEIAQDPDILDTWFSSALWPFATLGWPDQTPDLERFYPTSFMNTSSQILYLWIARMIMMGIHFTGQIPFPLVLINPTILNEKGQRMSKSLGTGIDPVETADRYGADATRFGVLSAGNITQQEIRFAGYERAEEGQKFANKIWNVARFVLQNLDREGDAGSMHLEPPDCWILSRMDAIAEAVTADIERFDLTSALRTAHDFFWSELADWYVEMAKPRLRLPGSASTVRAVLWSALERSMRLLHPYMPFVTEEIWQHLRATVPVGAFELSQLRDPLPESIMIAPWPSFGQARDEAAERDLATVMAVVTGIRNLRGEHRLNPRTRISATAISGPRAEVLRRLSPVVCDLAGLERLEVRESAVGNANSAELLAGGVTVQVPLSQLRSAGDEVNRLERDLTKKRAEMDRLAKLLDDPKFVERAPEHIVRGEREKLERLVGAVSQQEEQLRRMSRGGLV